MRGSLIHHSDRAAHVRYDEPDAGIKFSGMPLDFGDHSARLGRASRLRGEIGMEPTHLIGRSPDWALEQIADPALENLVGRQPDHILDPLGLQVIVDARHGEGCIGPEIDARDLAPVAHDDRLEHAVPPVGPVNVAGTQGAAFQITKHGTKVPGGQSKFSGAVLARLDKSGEFFLMATIFAP